MSLSLNIVSVKGVTNCKGRVTGKPCVIIISRLSSHDARLCVCVCACVPARMRAQKEKARGSSCMLGLAVSTQAVPTLGSTVLLLVS